VTEGRHPTPWASHGTRGPGPGSDRPGPVQGPVQGYVRPRVRSGVRPVQGKGKVRARGAGQGPTPAQVRAPTRRRRSGLEVRVWSIHVLLTLTLP
jgi:hypothetical protein